MKKIVVIGCYFGKLRSDYKTWLKSCSYNSSIDWLIFSDCKWEDLPSNVKVVNSTFSDFASKVKSCFDFDICLENAYKLCDYKPAYGYIFSEYIKGYDFWGYCDFDMIFGDIRKFISEEVLEEYDKIYHLGHLSLYRNHDKINKAFMSKKGNMYYKDVFKTSIIKVFDEEGMCSIFKNEGFKTYQKIDFVDISKFSKKMLHSKLERYFDIEKPINYHFQTFMFDNGKLYKVYKKFFSKEMIYDEIVYLHYSGKSYPSVIDANKFLITSKGLKEIPDNLFQYDRTLCFALEKILMLVREFKFRVVRKMNKIKQQKKEENYDA